MGGSSTTRTEGSKLAGMNIQSSSLGDPIPLIWGRTKISCNLLDYLNFTAIPHTETTKTSGGKGGGSTTTNTTYTYTASVLMGLCDALILGIVSVYKDSATFTGPSALADAGLSVALGSLTQTPWSYLVSLYPSHALAYRGIAYVYAEDYDLGDTATLANHSFEVDGAIQLDHAGGVYDANPKDVIDDFLNNPNTGVPSWPASANGDWSDFSLYCRAANLLISPALTSYETASDILARWLEIANSDCFYSEGLLKIKPLGDASVTANGVTWTPDLTPQYLLDDDDFEEEPTQRIKDQSDSYNRVTVEYSDRSTQYNPAPSPAYDLDNIIKFGRRQEDTVTYHEICDGGIARTVAQIRLQRVLYIRDKYEFVLPEDFVLLEPMDYVALTTESDELSLNNLLVRIESIEENEEQEGDDGSFNVVAEIVPGHVASAAQYAAHVATRFRPDLEADPGNVATPIFFNAPSSLAINGPEVWAAICGVNAAWGGAYAWVSFDGTNYNQVGKVAAPARFGILTANLADHADPDNTNTLSVDLTTSKAALNTVTSAEAAAGASLCMIGSELLSYTNAALTSAYHYNLTALNRGQRGSAHAAHLSGDTFIRLDEAILRIGYLPENVGATMHIKFQSFNSFGRALQDLSLVTAYTFTLAQNTALPAAASAPALAGGGTTWVGPRMDLICDPIDRATSYQFDIYKADGTTFIRSITSASPSASYSSAMAALDGAQRSYKVKVTGINSAGPGFASSQSAFTNSAPAALASPSASGGATLGQVTATASTDPDISGYIVYYSSTTGFDPQTVGATVISGTLPVSIYGLPAGTWYCRIAAFDPWTASPALLNLSTELNFVITVGGGSTPTGGGDTGGGYDGGGKFTNLGSQ